MKRILAISGSASENSSNAKLLCAIADAFSDQYEIEVHEGLWKLPLFTPQLQEVGMPDPVAALKRKVTEADAVIISTPEYLHNIPAVLKNALEWMTGSGELADKSVLAITFTPAAPRGEYAMISLLQSLKATTARVIAELPLYRADVTDQKGQIVLDDGHLAVIEAALHLL
jgi:chromate reductase